jgi:hypothetical protein
VRRALLRPFFPGIGRVVSNNDEERTVLLLIAACGFRVSLYPNRWMAHKHVEEIPSALETLVARLGELEVVLGTGVAPQLAAIRATLVEALAARGRGDALGAVARIGEAMDRLSALADHLDPAEAILMRALTHTFRAALVRGDENQVKHSTAAMFKKSGAVERKRRGS